MSRPTFVITAALVCFAGSAAGDPALSATQEPVATVISAAARWAGPDTITVNAVVQLNDSCWSDPRFVAPLNLRPGPPSPVVPIWVMADHETGKMCAQIVRTAVVPTYKWRTSPGPRPTAVKVFGSAHPLTVTIQRR